MPAHLGPHVHQHLADRALVQLKKEEAVAKRAAAESQRAATLKRSATAAAAALSLYDDVWYDALDRSVIPACAVALTPAGADAVRWAARVASHPKLSRGDPDAAVEGLAREVADARAAQAQDVAAAAVAIQCAVRRLFACQRVRRYVLVRFEKRFDERRGYPIYIDTAEEAERAAPTKVRLERRAVKSTKPPLVLHGESLPSPRSARRRLANEQQRGDERLARARAVEGAAADAIGSKAARTDRLLALGNVLDAVGKAWTHLDAKHCLETALHKELDTPAIDAGDTLAKKRLAETDWTGKGYRARLAFAAPFGGTGAVSPALRDGTVQKMLEAERVAKLPKAVAGAGDGDPASNLAAAAAAASQGAPLGGGDLPPAPWLASKSAAAVADADADTHATDTDAGPAVTANARLVELREQCARRATFDEHGAALAGLKLLLAEPGTRRAVDAGTALLNGGAWPLPSVFPVPLVLKKEVTVVDRAFRLRAFLYKGELAALTQTATLVRDSELCDRIDDVVDGVVDFFRASATRFYDILKTLGEPGSLATLTEGEAADLLRCGADRAVLDREKTDALAFLEGEEDDDAKTKGTNDADSASVAGSSAPSSPAKSPSKPMGSPLRSPGKAGMQWAAVKHELRTVHASEGTPNLEAPWALARHALSKADGLPPDYDSLAVDLVVDLKTAQLKRERELGFRGIEVPTFGQPKTRVYVAHLAPYSHAAGEVPADLGLFDFDVAEDANALRGLALKPKAAGGAAAAAADEDGDGGADEDNDDEEPTGWLPIDPLTGVHAYKQRVTSYRSLEIRIRGAPAVDAALKATGPVVYGALLSDTARPGVAEAAPAASPGGATRRGRRRSTRGKGGANKLPARRGSSVGSSGEGSS